MRNFSATFVKLCAAFVISSAAAKTYEIVPAGELARLLDEKPSKSRKVNTIQYFPQEGRQVNFGMNALVWAEKGDCESQKEKMSAIIEVQGRSVTVRNAYLINSLDGIHVKNSDCVLERLVFPKVCEDAITAEPGADRLVIRNCVFRGARDKAIQLNAGRDILIENCYFEDCAKPVRVKAGVTVTVRNCVAKNVVDFVLADGVGAVAIVEGNRVEGAKFFLKAQKGAEIRAGANETSKIKNERVAESGGRIVPK